MHTRHQLAHAERLGHVVVGPEPEPDENVGFRIPRGEHQDRDGPIVLDPPADLEPVEYGEHHVQDHEVGLDPLAEVDPRRPVGGDLDREPFLAEARGDSSGDGLFVFDDRDGSHGVSLGNGCG
jgi:hypothetical protein